MKSRLALAVTLALLPAAAVAQPVRPNILVVFDTSTSMLAESKFDGSPLCGGQGQSSRIFRLKQAIRDTLVELGNDEANFGLARFAQRTTPATNRGCFTGHYVNAVETGTSAGCKTSAPAEAEADFAWFTPQYAQEVVTVPVTRVLDPAGPADYDPPGSNVVEILRWLDNEEASNGTMMTNPEIRSGGSKTPLAATVTYAKLYFQRYVKPRDPKTACRKNIVILVTDGAETCRTENDAVNAARALFQAGVELYVVVQQGETGNVHDRMADVGSGGARKQSIKVDFTNPGATKAALIGIIADAVPPGEICNGVDDNCNMSVDEEPLPGVGQPCVCPGLMESQIGKGICKGGTTVCKGKDGIACEGCVLPQPEICNGVDDNCNGQIDENVPGEGEACACGQDSLMTLMTGECKPGRRVCRGRMPLDCEGCVTPAKEVCDCKDNNCNGREDEDNPCGEGLACIKRADVCSCEPLCRDGEFRCPAGFFCDDNSRPPVCVSRRCEGKICPTGYTCDPGTGQCVDACQGVTCTAPQTCKLGRCVDCYSVFGMCDKPGQVCLQGVCKDSPCLNKKCGEGQFCNGKGECEALCSPGCPQGQVCKAGKCKADPCTAASCNPSTHVCDPGTGECKPNLCKSMTCTKRCVPLTGECIDDPCRVASCPNGCFDCVMDDSGAARCIEKAICTGGQGNVLARGSGCSCAVGAGAAGALGALPLLAVGLLALVRRRRRR